MCWIRKNRREQGELGCLRALLGRWWEGPCGGREFGAKGTVCNAEVRVSLGVQGIAKRSLCLWSEGSELERRGKWGWEVRGADRVDLMDNWKDICLFSGGNGEVLEGFERGGPWNEPHFTRTLALVLTMDSGGKERMRGEQARFGEFLQGSRGNGAGWKQWRWWEVDSELYLKGRTNRIPNRLGTKREV